MIQDKVLQRISDEFSANIKGVVPLTPDASLRRYFRIELSGNCPATMLAMVFDSLKSPEAGGQGALPADESYVGIAEFFEKNGIAVPKTYAFFNDEHVVLIEDLGSRHLIDSFSESANRVDSLYMGAVDEIAKITSLKGDYFPFKRSMSAEVLFKEMREFTDFYLGFENQGLLDSFSQISNELSSFPKVLVHRDFHSWNIMYEDRVRVIDFQDALLAPAVYDIVALLNDRDTDQILGRERYRRLFDYFCEQQGIDYRYDFHLCSLQRDLKVAGRFSKLVKERGLVGYGKWIPGTVARIGRTLNWLEVRGGTGQTDFSAMIAGLQSAPVKLNLKESSYLG